MEIQVSVPDTASAARLAQRLAGASDAVSVSFEPGRKDLRLQTKRESNRAVVDVIAVVDAWLAEAGAGGARVSVGQRSFTMAGPGQIQAAWL